MLSEACTDFFKPQATQVHFDTINSVEELMSNKVTESSPMKNSQYTDFVDENMIDSVLDNKKVH